MKIRKSLQKTRHQNQKDSLKQRKEAKLDCLKVSKRKMRVILIKEQQSYQ